MDKKTKSKILELIAQNNVKQLRIGCLDGYTVLQYKIQNDYLILSKNNAGKYKITYGGFTAGEINPGDKKITAAEKIDILDLYAAAEQKFYTQNINDKKIR